MEGESMLSVRLGQKFKHRSEKVVYVVKSVRDKNVVLASENGEAGMIIQIDDIRLSRFEPVYD